jgi:carboxyl-terminal processing protease
VAGIVALLAAVFVLGAIVGAPVRDTVLPSQDSLPDQVSKAVADRFEGTVDRAKLEQAGAKAIAAAAGDRWTTYFTPREWAQIKRASEGQYSGIGVTIQAEDDALVVREVFPRSPAATAGLKADDRIVAVGGVPVARRGPVKSRQAILGTPGTTVRLTVESPGAAPRIVRVTRGDVTVPMVDARMVTGPKGAKVAYIELDRFEKGAGEQVRQQAMRLIGEGATAVVLDLRGDPGGLLDEAVAVSGVFLEPGSLVVSTSGRASPKRELKADGDPIPADIPVAVLVDGASASASEIVAGALKDDGRAVLVGTPTFGKSKVQVTRETSDGGAVRVTVATYLTPKGTDIGRGGVTPSVRASDKASTDADEALDAALAALATKGG